MRAGRGRTRVGMDVAAVGAVATAPLAVDPSTPTASASGTSSSSSSSGAATATVDSFANVNLAEMIASRLNTASSTTTSGVGGIATGQVASIIRAANVTVTSGIGGAGPLNVPPELLAYGNGHIPRDLLTPIGIGQHRLYSVAAQAFIKMRSDAAAQGVDISVTDSYRSYDEQVDLAARKGLWKDGGYAAVPGTSPHGWGMAVDLDVSPAGLAWVRANGANYGFKETTPREPWHWEYRGAI
ncbi:MAG: D-alanyl-D-alanine carboxypeptidase [Ilumatobacteraceae bacterium]|nr:D-alanyl-D-alanine carboxypeptidase [Ilumatobacteraceae bacterium]